MENDKYFKDFTPIPIGHYIALGAGDLDSALDRAYEDGKEDFRESVIKVLEFVLKDETLKILLIEKIEKLNKCEY